MSMMTKSMLTVVITTAVVALFGYFFGFAMLFAHTTAEICWYGLLFGGSNILALGALWFANKDVSESKTPAKKAPASSAKSTPATA